MPHDLTNLAGSQKLAVVRVPRRTTRTLGDKLQEIARRSPQDYLAFDRIADLVLTRLNHTASRGRVKTSS